MIVLVPGPSHHPKIMWLPSDDKTSIGWGEGRGLGTRPSDDKTSIGRGEGWCLGTRLSDDKTSTGPCKADLLFHISTGFI